MPKRETTKTKSAGTKSKTSTRTKKSGATVTKSRTVSKSAKGKKVTKTRSVTGKKNKENYIGGKPQINNYSRTVEREKDKLWRDRRVTKTGSSNDGTGNTAVETKRVTRLKRPSTYKHTKKERYVTSPKGKLDINNMGSIKGKFVSGSSASSKTRKSIKNMLGLGKWRKK
tara:strand:- start:13 stop:522 length:510 start_codon:yes stop_codon:yes gene_type:complete